MKHNQSSETLSVSFQPFDKNGLKDCLSDGRIALVYGNGTEISAHRCFEHIMHEAGWNVCYSCLQRSFRGKPFAEGVPVQFNLSHASGSYLIAFSLKPNLGVDLESRIPGNNLNALISYAFSPDERNLLPASEPQTFLKLWTLKEAYLKATGIGLLDALPTLHAVGPRKSGASGKPGEQEEPGTTGAPENSADRNKKNQPEFRLMNPSFEGFNFNCPGGETGALVCLAPISASPVGFTVNGQWV